MMVGRYGHSRKENRIVNTPRLFIVVGSPGSGKDILVRAISDLGSLHAEIVPKHTSRSRNLDDGSEMICPGDKDFAFDRCDIQYSNYEDTYGIESSRIWNGLRTGHSQVLVVSNVGAINILRKTFGPLIVLLYVHSEIAPDEFAKSEALHGNPQAYIRRRADKYRMAFDNFLSNFLAFDHVLIYAGVAEDLYDQIFRLFRAYESAAL